MWRLGNYLSSLTKPELEEIIEQCNFSDEEVIIFNMLSKRKGIIEISMEVGVSQKTIDRRVVDMKKKIIKVTQNGQEIKNMDEIILDDERKKQILSAIY